MRHPITWTLVAILTTAATAEAQRGGGGRGQDRLSRWIRPDPVQERVGVFFHDVAGPATDGDKVADLDTIDLVRAAAAAEQLSLLYLHDGKANEQGVRWFESVLFRPDAQNDELSAKLRCMHCGRIDIGKDAALQTRYGADVPLFIAFDESGKEVGTVSMVGYEAAANDLEKLIDKAARGFKPNLKSFAKKYGRWIGDFEKLLRDKQQAEREQMQAGDSKAKQIKAKRELEALQREEQKLLDDERKLLEDMRLPARGSQRIGGGRLDRGDRGGSGRGNTGPGNTGEGNTGRGNTGRGNKDRGNTGRG